MKNKKKFTILLLAMFFVVVGAVGAVFYYEAPGDEVVYAAHGGSGGSGGMPQIGAFRGLGLSIGEIGSILASPDMIHRMHCGNNAAFIFNRGKVVRRKPPPPPPPPTFGVSAGGGSDGGTSGATSGGSGTPGTGASSITINEGSAVTMSFACVDSTSSSGLNFSTGGDASGSVSINPLDTTTYTVVCSNGGRSSVDVTVLHPVLEITADPTQVRSGRESLITWSATVVDSCNVTGTNGFSATGLSGSQPSNPITLQSIFTLTCENVAGTLSKSVTVYLIPEFREF
jgi:hypothetical protein